MPPRKAPKKNAFGATAAAPDSGRDHISNLPDGVLHHMLSFLPALDVVRTCVLAKRWRHMWKPTTALRFVPGGTKEQKSVEEIQGFVDHLLRMRIRGGTPLDTCEFDFVDADVKDMTRINLWIRIALHCQVRELRLTCSGITLPLDDHPFFISQYLKKLELHDLDFEMMPSRFLDFSCCPVLEDLEIFHCTLEGALLISSQSLKRLTIHSCYLPNDYRVPICAPSLVSLRLVVDAGRTPSLQRMPSLLAAYVQMFTDDDCVSLSSDDDDNNQSILLQGFSDVRDLVLMSYDFEMFIFRRDLRFCSSFNKWKSLLLDEYWYEPPDFSALACLLKLSPVLEKLSLHLYSEETKHEVDIKLSCKPLEVSAAISRQLRTVEVCKVCDERLQNILAFLSKLNIRFEFVGKDVLHED